LAPVQWPVTDNAPEGTQRLFGAGGFFTESGKAALIAVAPQWPQVPVDDAYPLLLNTGRIRDQWHTMTRTGRVARLTGHMPEPFVQIHPDDAAVAEVSDGDLARVTSRAGTLIARVNVAPEQRVGSVFVPMHWSEQFASAARVGALVAAITDPISGQPESKHTPVRVEPFIAEWHAFVLSRRDLSQLGGDYAVRVRGEDFWRYELAGRQGIQDWGAWARERLGEDGDWLEFADRGAGRHRVAKLVDGRLEAVVFAAPGYELPARSWLGRLFALTELDDGVRASLLTGRPAEGQSDAGRIVCSCFGVGINTILDAIKTQDLTTVEAIGDALSAGTNCGSCIPELRRALASLPGRAAA
jgi:assimilatory nitrate reductase catalytic subunit